MRALLEAAAAVEKDQRCARPDLTMPLTPEEHTGGVCRNLTDVAASFCALPSETLLKLDVDEIDHIRQALTGALVVLRLAEGVRRA